MADGERWTPKDVLALSGPADGFLCPLSANVYDVQFLKFVISDVETKEEYFKVDASSPPPPLDQDTDDEVALRTIRFEFPVDVLRSSAISTMLEFMNGPSELKNFRLIERHFFEGKLIKSFDFSFGFVIPNSTNTWEAVYEVPPLEEGLIDRMMAAPYATKSDSFFFVGDDLIIHNKAEYKYVGGTDGKKQAVSPFWAQQFNS